MKLEPKHIRAVRLGHGANCSSVGSVIDTLFLSAAVGSAIFVAVCAAIEDDVKADGPKGVIPDSEPARAPEESE